MVGINTFEVVVFLTSVEAVIFFFFFFTGDSVVVVLTSVETCIFAKC